MAYAFFQISARASPEAAEPLNHVLRTRRVVHVTRQWCDAGSESFWAFCVEYTDAVEPDGATTRIDYREVLPPPQFELFVRLRSLRKTLAEREKQPVFAIFTNAQLAEFVQRGCRSLEEIRAIPGVGESRVAKYGAEVLAILKGEGGGT